MTELSRNVFAGPQIAPATLETLALEGFTDVVCNRPDSENPQGDSSPVMARRAAELGLRFHYLPIAPGETPTDQGLALARLAARPGARIFAYCRSGTRSSSAWALAEAKLDGAGQQAK